MRASAQNVRPQSRNGRSEWFAVVLGNDVAIKAYRDGEVTFPDGAIIASLHYRFVPSEENNKAFGQAQSFVPGDPTNVQFMDVRTSWCKDSVHKRAKAVGYGKFYPLFYAQASGMHHFDASGLVAQSNAQALDVEVAPSERWVAESLRLGHTFTFRALFDFNEEAKLGFDGELEAAHNFFYGPSAPEKNDIAPDRIFRGNPPIAGVEQQR